MHILLPSDVFPPGSVGGAAWSAHTLARALIARGHNVTAVTPTQGRHRMSCEDVGGVPTLRWGYHAPPIPFVQNYFRHERLWEPLASVLIQVAKASGADIIHAQHVQTIPAAVLAGQRLGVPVVATVRDHWPWDYFATGLHGDRLPYERTTWASLMADLPVRLGPLRGVSALLALPYMLVHVRRRAAFLAQADAVIAVSRYMAGRLAAIVPAECIRVIPNMVDIEENERIAATSPQTVLDGPFLLFAGKLERNKGAGLLLDIFRALRTELEISDGKWKLSFPTPNSQSPIPNPQSLISLIIAGSGSLKPELERELAALGVRARFLSWVHHDEVLRLMARCEALLFPSAWGEPLSRVPLEASALGVPIVAMPTGGTPDIITDGVHGALAATPAQFARRLAALLNDPAERRRLGEQARRHARDRFAVVAVVPQVEHLYNELLHEKFPAKYG